MAQLARALLGHLRDLVIIQEVKDPAGLVDGSESELAVLREHAAAAPAGLLPLLFERLSRLCQEMAQPGATLQRAMLELALVDCVHVEPLEPLGELVERLERLEKGGVRGSGGGLPVAAKPAAPVAAKPAAPAATKPAAVATKPVAAAAAKPVAGLAAWETIVSAVEKRKAVLASSLALASATLSERKLELGFPEDAHSQLEYVQDADNLAVLRAICKDTLGRDVEIVVSKVAGTTLKSQNGHASAPAAQGSLHARDVERASADRAEREAESRAHPVVRAAQDVFGSTLQEIKTDNIE